MLLEKVNSPADIRKFSTAQLKQLCAEIRQYMVECCAKNPGHLGSSLGAVELMFTGLCVFALVAALVFARNSRKHPELKLDAPSR